MSPFGLIRGWSLRRRAFVLLILAAGIPPLVVAGILLQNQRTTRRSANEAVLRARVEGVGRSLEVLSRSYAAAAARAAADPDLAGFCESTKDGQAFQRPLVQIRLRAIRREDPVIMGLGIMDSTGIVIASTEEQIVGTSLAFREYFHNALAGTTAPEFYVSVPATGRIPLVAFPAPILRHGRTVGVFAIYVRGQAFWDEMRTASDLAEAGCYFILFDRYGIRIGHTGNPSLLFHPSTALPAEVARAMLASQRFQERTGELLSQVELFPPELLGTTHTTRTFRRFSPNHVWNIGVSLFLPSLDWTLVAMVPESVVEVPLATVVPRVLPATILGLVLALLAGALLMRSIVKPIRTLATGAAALERGELSEPFSIGGEDGLDELSVMSRAFRSMAATLTERDRNLRAGNNDLRQVLDSVGEGLLAADPAGSISGVHSAVMETWFGPVRPGEPLWRYLGREDSAFAFTLEQGWKQLADAGIPFERALALLPARIEREGHTFDVAYRSVEAQGRLERVILVITDVTEQLAQQIAERQLEAELRQAQKLEAVGQLASGIAHEINTPIQYVGDGTRFVKDAFTSVAEVLRVHQAALGSVQLPSEVEVRLRSAVEAADLDYILEEVPKASAQVLEGVQRVSSIVRAMKEFAHPDQKEMVPMDLNRALSATLEISRNEYKYIADVQTDYGDVPLVCCHAGELNQVFLNIIVNAAHAIADVVEETKGRGVIGVRTRAEAGHVIVAISDTGGGIPCEIQDKIFDPFFTTKPVGRGTGQGLAIARSVVKKHAGQLTFTTEPGRGTTFVVRLPTSGPETVDIARQV